LLEGAIDGLRRTAGLTVQLANLQQHHDRHLRADAAIDVIVEGEEEHRYLVEMKKADRFAVLGPIKQQFERYNEPALLLAPQITPEMADRCREMDIQFIDAAGNAYLHAPGLFVFVKGQRLPEGIHLAPNTTQRAGTPGALRMVFAILCQPKLLKAPYREIVDAAGIALGGVGWVFNDLEARGFITGGQRKGKRRLLEPTKLFEEWVTNYPIKLRPKLNPRRFRAENPDWWKNADIAQYGALWGGEVAADRLTHYLKPATRTIYVREKGERDTVKELVVAHRLRADPKGDIEILDAFWDLPNDPDHPDTVPPILVYADLVATMDTRNLETARLIREKYIDDVLRQF
jgi:hypothetical protein